MAYGTSPLSGQPPNPLTANQRAEPTLVYSQPAPGDLDGYAAMLADPRVTRYLPGHAPRTREQAGRTLNLFIGHWAEHGWGPWTLRTPTPAGDFIGYCGLRHVPDLGVIEVLYSLNPAHHGHGYAATAARRAVVMGLTELALPRIVGYVIPDNTPSRRVLERAGLTLVGPTEAFGLADLLLYEVRRG